MGEGAMARHDTIFALATGHGRAGVAMVRVSGPAARFAVQTITRKPPPPPRQAAIRALRNAGGAVFDRGLVLWFPAPNSLTGEDVCEFQIHGGPAVIGALNEALAVIPGLRLAGPGEFTRRAVENGRLDLTQAEAVADLVEAETPAQARQALRQYDGALAAVIDGWRNDLAKVLAWAEAAIDFSDEELPEDVLAEARELAGRTGADIARHLDDGRRGELVREGLFVAVIGAPNAGKSSLVNALAGRDVAIVSEAAGTTRDVIEVRLNLGGYAVILADTAGLRAAADSIEAEGVRRALKQAEDADLVVVVQDGSVTNNILENNNKLDSKTVLSIWNKADLPWPAVPEGLHLSLKTGEGLEAVVEAITLAAKTKLEGGGEAPLITRARHREALREAVAALDRAAGAAAPELFAEDLRLAVRAMGRITGRVDVEDLLDLIFRDFCIGK
jgi:tRNA modification GTPase